jgi:hypothetical protein
MEITGDMTNTNIYGKGVIESDGNDLYIGTYGGGVFRSIDIARITSEYETLNPLNIFPKPTSGIATLNLKQVDISAFRIININGKDVSSMAHLTALESDRIIIDLSDLATGTYAAQINGIALGKTHRL